MFVLAIVGLSGLGKSTIISELETATPLRHFAASVLIKSELALCKSQIATSEELRSGPVVDNQVLLASAFARCTEGLRASWCLMDCGHRWGVRARRCSRVGVWRIGRSAHAVHPRECPCDRRTSSERCPSRQTATDYDRNHIASGACTNASEDHNRSAWHSANGAGFE